MKKIYSLLAVMAIAGTAFAQEINKAPYTGDKEADLSARQNIGTPASNRAVLWSEDFGAGIPATWSNVTIQGPVDWKYTTVGHTGAYPTAALMSTTANNGWIIVDSDGDNFNGGGAEESELTTDVIDLSGAGATDFRISFQQMFRRWQSDSCLLQVSTDGFATFQEWQVNAGVDQSGTPNPDFQTFNITTAISGNLANVQIRFRWIGQWDYGWQVDDIVIEDIPPHDLRAKNPHINNFIEYFMSPGIQVQPYDFSCDVQNLGLGTENNVRLDVDVNDGTSSVFTGSSASVNQVPMATDSLSVPGYVPNACADYTVTFTAAMDSVDSNPVDNVVTMNFSVTDTVWARDDGINGGGLSNGQTSYEYGCEYDVVADDVATSISIGLDTRTVVGALVYGVIYSVDAQGNFVYETQTSDYTITAGDLGGWITIPVSGGFNLTNGEPYIVLAGSYGGTDSLVIMRGGNSAPDQTCFLLDGTDNTWYFTNRTPAVRLNTQGGCPVGIAEDMENGIVLSQNMPNPFSGVTNILYSLETASNVTFEVIDVTGKVVMTSYEGNKAAGQEFTFQLDGSALQSGVYFYSLITDNGRVTRQMVINR